MQSPSYVELVETSRWRVARNTTIMQCANTKQLNISQLHEYYGRADRLRITRDSQSILYDSKVEGNN